MRTKKDSKLTVGYVRSAIKDDLSVKKQEKQIRKYCLENGYKLAKVFVDNGNSGANLIRPAFQDLLAEMSKGNISQVICLDICRLSRNITEYLCLKNLFSKYGTKIITVTEISVNDDAIPKCIDELLATLNSLQPRLNEYKRMQKESGK